MRIMETRSGSSTGDGGPSFDLRHYEWKEVVARLKPLIRPRLWRCVTSMLLVSVVGVAVAVVPLFPKYVLDSAIPKNSIKLAIVAAVVFLVIQFARMAIWFMAMMRVYRIQQEIVFELRSNSFAHLQKLCLRFHSRYSSGFIYERVFGNSINNLGTFLQSAFQQLAVQVSGLLFSMVFCLWLSPPLTLVIFAGALGYVFAARKLSKRIYEKTRLSSEAGMRVVGIIMDKLRGHKTIKSFAIEQAVQDEFDDELWPVMNKWLDAVLESMRLGFVTEGLSYFITAVVVVGGAWMVMNNGQPVGVMVAFIGYQGMLIGMIQGLTNFHGQFMAARSAFDNLYTVLDTHSTVVELPGTTAPAVQTGDFEFRNVTFGYEPSRPVVSDVSFSVPYGSAIALVGRSGSGKTTLANLLMRFYDPDSGSILLDGKDIRGMPASGYRSLFGVVLQDPHLFDTTIANNLRYVRPNATDEELIEVLENARAWDFVEKFPDKLKHRVGEAGGQLSGGQRQRIAIARCMLTRSKFVILDEATSALDAESEDLVQEAMSSLFSKKTVFVVAHRLRTIRNANCVLVMDNGRLVEKGTFDELLEARGLLRRLHDIATSTESHKSRIRHAGFA